MNLLRRRMLHPLRSRHNPLTRAALIFTLAVASTAALVAGLELRDLRVLNVANQKALAEMFLFLDGKITLTEVHGRYAVEYSVATNTYEVK